MKRIVQRLALAFLLLLPMLANATVTGTVNYAARGAVTEVNTTEDPVYDILVVTVNSGYELVNDESWFNNGVLIVPGTTAGTLAQTKEGNVYKLKLAKDQDWDIKAKIFRTHPTLTIVDDHGTLDGSVSYAFGTNVELSTVSSTIEDGYTFNGWINYANPSDLTDTISKVDPYVFRITEDTAIYVGYKAAMRHVVLLTNYPGAAHHPALTYKINGENYTIGDVVDIEHGSTATIEVTGAGVAPFQFMDDGVHFGVWGRDNDLDGTDDVTDYDVTTPYSFTVTSDVNVTCYFDPTETYTITAKGEDDDDLGYVTMAPAGPYAWGDTIVMTPYDNDATATKFKNWVDDPTNTDNPRMVIATGNADYLAHFDYNKYKINVTGEGYTFAFSRDTTGGIYWGNDLTITATPPTGQVFEKWSDENTDNPRSLYVFEDVTLVAYSQPDTRTVVVAIDDAAHGTVEIVGDATVNYGEDVTVKANISDNAKYLFKEWRNGTTVLSTDNPYTFALNDNITVTAYYDTVAYDITVTGGTAEPASVKYMADFTLTATPVDGYTFDHWELNGMTVATTTPAVQTLNAAEARTYVAVNTANDYTVTANVNDALMGSVTGVSNPYHVGDAVVLTAVPAAHHHLVKWDDNSTNTTLSFTMPASNVEHTATFGIDSVVVTVAADANGSATINGLASDELPYGSLVNTLVAATPNTDYEFDKWQVAGVDIDINTWTVPETAVTLTAVFKHVAVTVTTATEPAALTTTSIDPASPAFGDHIHMLYTPVEGYTFAGWTLAGESDVIADSTDYEIVATTTNLVAHFNINTYTITIAVNDNAMGTATIDGADHADGVEFGSAVDTRVVATANPGYEFVKWQANGVDVADITAWTMLDEDVTLTAVFNYLPLSVTASVEDSAGVADFTAHTTTMGTPGSFTFTGNNIIGGIVTTTAPDIAGWHFNNWSDGRTTNPRKDTLTSSDPITLTAIFAIDSFTVALVSNYGEDVEFTGAGRYAHGADATINATVAAAKADSLEFIKWGATDANTDSPRIVNVVSDTTFTPVFGVIEYTVNATTDGNGSITAPATLPVGVAYGQTVTITAEANHGYDFVNWTNNVNTDELTDLTIAPKVTADVTWTANFEKTDYTVTAVVKDMAGNEQSTMATVTGAGDYEFEASATLSYTANDGFTFVKWIGEGAGEEATTASITFGVNNDTTIIAQFDTLTTSVTADVDDAAHGSVAVSNGTPKYYTQVTLTVTENPGYEFKYWADDNTNTANPRTIDVTFGTTHSYTAVFEPRQYTVTVANTDGNGTVAITGTTENNVTVDFAETVQIVATANTGYSFDKWNGTIATATYDYVVAAKDTTFTATFVPNTNDLTITSSNFYRGGVRFGTTGDSLETDTKTAIAFNETTHIEALPAYGYAFDSWSDDPTAPAKRDYVFTTDDDVALTANFVYAPYTIKVNLNDAALATIELNGTEVESGDETPFGYTEHVTVTVTPVANYHIIHGTTPYTSTNPLSFGVDVLENLEYNYEIVPDTFAVSITAAGNGSIANFTNGDFAYGEVISGVKAVADENYHFLNWSDAETTEIHSDITVDGDITLTANFSIDAYDFTVVSEDPAKGTVTGTQTGVNHGDNVTATATPLTGYVFSNWTDGNGTEVSTDNPYVFALTATTTLTAHFANEAYDLTVSTFTPERGWISVVDGNAVETKDETGATFTVNDLPTHTDITVIATANTGYHFVEWSDDATAPAQRTIQLTKDTSFTANFAYDTYTVTWDANVAARGTIETLGTVAYHFGAVDTLKAVPAAGYVFQKWEDGSIANPRYYTVNGDADLTAIFIYETTNDAITACDSYEWEGHTYTVTEVAPAATLTDVEGYDSIVVMTVNINYSTTGDTVATECDAFEWRGENRTTSGDYEYVMAAANQNGCDSTITLHLTINQHQDSEETVAECVTYDWIVNGQTYTESGNYTSPIVDANGCDATAILNLTINQPSNGIDVQEHCDSYTWIDNVTYTESTNTPSFVLTAADQNGCDSTVTLNLTINQTAGVKVVETACDTYTWSLNDNEYTASGEYTYGYLNASGCYVVDTLVLTVNHNSSTRFPNQDVCDQYVQTWNDAVVETITYSAEYLHPYTSAEGCPSMDTLLVSIRPSTSGTMVAEACDSYTWELNGETYTESNNTATATLTAANGCDSVVTLNLTVNHNTNNVYSEDACIETTIIWGDNTDTLVNVSGVYTHEYETIAGCPSTDVVTVTILEPTAAVDEQHACNSFTWIDGITYTESNNTAEFTLTNAAGCDSIVTLNLTVTYDQVVDVYDTACDSYVWNGLTFTNSRDVVYTTTDMFGCDSTTTLHLTINESNTFEFADSAYGIYTWNEETYQTSGAYQQTLTNAAGCDSVVTLNLNILLPDNPYVYVEACVSYTWENTLMSDSSVAGNNMTYTEKGIYNDTISSVVSGGDSVINTLYLTIYQPVATTDAATACDSFSWNNNVYTVSGVYVDTLATIHGCDSIVTMTLTINNAVTNNTAATACGTYTWNDSVYTESGVYTQTFTAANGCDSVVNMTLTINQAVASAFSDTACGTYTWGTRTYDQSGIYNQIFAAANGCDSTVTLTLTINNAVNPDAVVATACGTYTWHGDRTATGIYTFDTVDANGCAITETLDLTINTPVSTTESETACDSMLWHGVTYTASGTYSDTLTAANGCDSIVTLNLVINQHQDATETVAACDSYTWQGTTYTTSGTYTAAITDANGCAATATLELTINTPVNTTESATECGSYTWHGTTYTTSGTYTAAITDANGCAATATLNLTINTPVNTTESASACDTYTWTVNNTAYTTSGTYTAAITDANGCAATATLNLTINQSVATAIALSDTGSVTFNNVTYTADTVVVLNLTTAAGCDSVVTATITVIAEQQPEPDSLMVNIMAAFPTHGSVNPSGYGFYHMGDVLNVTATPDSGYTFAFWHVSYIDNNGTTSDTIYTNPLVYTIDSVDMYYSIINIMAEFESISGIEDSLTVIVAAADASMGTTNPVPGTYRLALGETLTVSAVANDGYHIAYWIEENHGLLTYSDTIISDTILVIANSLNLTDTAYLTAYFEADVVDTVYHFVTLMSADALMGSVSASDSVIEGETFTATAYPNEGYHFVSWNNGSVVMSNENPYVFTVNADITLTAIFEADPVDTVYYNVAVSYDATMGTVTGEGRYVEGTIVTLNATANWGYHFVAWLDANNNVLTTTHDYTFTVSADMNFTAQFAAVPVYYTVIGQPNDPTMGEVTGSGQYEEGATATLNVQAYEGYHFVRWSNGETTPTLTFTVTADVTYIAYFEVNDTPQAIDETDMSNVTVYSAESRIIVRGAEGMDVNVYDINGRTINSQMNVGEIVEFRMATTGVYLVKVGNAPAKRVLVVR